MMEGEKEELSETKLEKGFIKKINIFDNIKLFILSVHKRCAMQKMSRSEDK